jgi:hypothetical protein
VTWNFTAPQAHDPCRGDSGEGMQGAYARYANSTDG